MRCRAGEKRDRSVSSVRLAEPYLTGPWHVQAAEAQRIADEAAAKAAERAAEAKAREEEMKVDARVWHAVARQRERGARAPLVGAADDDAPCARVRVCRRSRPREMNCASFRRRPLRTCPRASKVRQMNTHSTGAEGNTRIHTLCSNTRIHTLASVLAATGWASFKSARNGYCDVHVLVVACTRHACTHAHRKLKTLQKPRFLHSDAVSRGISPSRLVRLSAGLNAEALEHVSQVLSSLQVKTKLILPCRAVDGDETSREFSH